MKEIHIKIIPHAEQRYDTCGDYFTDHNGVEQFRISRLPDARMEALVMIHELVEKVVCEFLGVPNEAIDMFDMEFEQKRADNIARGLIKPDAEPGDDPEAPYYQAHQIASAIERSLAVHLRVNWQRYEKTIQELSK